MELNHYHRRLVEKDKEALLDQQVEKKQNKTKTGVGKGNRRKSSAKSKDEQVVQDSGSAVEEGSGSDERRRHICVLYQYLSNIKMPFIHHVHDPAACGPTPCP